jgi:15-cis-phytoene synthase
MNGADPEILPPEAELALAWTPPMVRGALTTALQLDRRLARIVARTTEPMLGQMRLAWWREALTKPVEDRPRGDAVLDAVGQYWAGREAALAAMVDGWEVLITADRLGPVEAEAFGAGRGAFFAALCENVTPAQAERAAAAGFRWSIADAAASVSDAEERAVMIATGLAQDNLRARWPSDLRGLAVLDALSVRALRRGGCALMEGRGASLVALRAAIFLV